MSERIMAGVAGVKPGGKGEGETEEKRGRLGRERETPTMRGSFCSFLLPQNAA